MAPEVIQKKPQSFCLDFFSLGVVMYELIVGHRPYQGNSKKEIQEKILMYQAKLT